MLQLHACVSQEFMARLLCNSPQICSYTMDVLFNGLLAELPAIVLPIPQVITYMGDWSEVVRSHCSGGLNTRQVVILPSGPICALDTRPLKVYT